MYQPLMQPFCPNRPASASANGRCRRYWKDYRDFSAIKRPSYLELVNIMSSEDGFMVVKSKKKKRGTIFKLSPLQPDLTGRAPQDAVNTKAKTDTPNSETVMRKIRAAIKHLKADEYVHGFFEVFEECMLQLIDFHPVSQIICFGLGRVSSCTISRYQLAFLIYLQERLEVPVEIYDPVFSPLEILVLQDLNFQVLEKNEEGKRSVDKLSLLYMPHCSHQLVNNFLYSNWDPERLKNCIIVSNSFAKILETLPRQYVKQSLMYIARVQPYTLEYKIDNCFQFTDIFNDTAIHIFPHEKCEMIPKDYFSGNKLPEYSDFEFVPFTQEKNV